LARDELTGVLRRGAGLIELEREVARSGRSGDSFVIAFVDLDGLKGINDEGGHQSGDQALRNVGEDIADLIARADADLYQVRRSGQSDSPSGLPASHDDGAAVAAHTLLNSSAVVSMGITTLLAQHDELASPARRHLLERMLAHATRVDQRLKGITRGVLVLETLPPDD
jgi:GGDEF domain-containing protein